MRRLLAVLGLIIGLASPSFAQSEPPPANPPGMPADGVTQASAKAAAATVAAPAAPLSNIYAAGLSYNSAAHPAIAGTALYAKLIADGSGTYAFTAIDVLPTSARPFTVTTNVSAGIAQKIFTIGKVPIFVPTTAGVSWSGTNTGWAWSTGALASIHVGKGGWHIFPVVRVAHSNVSNGSGVQPIVGVMFGWGQ